MPADRDIALPSAGASRRDLARRLGVAGFWRWWMRMLASLVPAGPRAALERRRMRPVVAFVGDRAVVWQAQGSDGRVELVEVARVGTQGDTAAVAAEGRAALAKLSRRAPPLKVAVALPPRTILQKSLVLPAAVEHDLRQALSYDLDRHTPFRSEEVYFDAQVVDRDPARGQIRVEFAAARRAQVDAAVAQVQAWGAKVVAVTPAVPPALASTALNLLPPDMRNGTRFAKRWQFWLPIVVLGLVALVAVVLPVWQKREYAIALNDVATQAMQQAGASESLRTQLERQVGDYNFALERKYAYPGAVQVLEDVTKILPDDTWLTQLEIKSSARGESANAGRLVTLLEDSKLFTQAAPRSPTTKIQPGPGEIFDVAAQLKPLPQPAPVTLAVADKAVAPAPAPP
ncbi:MAG: pilus assembly protein PilM, partial [Casimicrobiaceae bacterium]